jgi:hypothetical protein
MSSLRLADERPPRAGGKAWDIARNNRVVEISEVEYLGEIIVSVVRFALDLAHASDNGPDFTRMELPIARKFSE